MRKKQGQIDEGKTQRVRKKEGGREYMEKFCREKRGTRMEEVGRQCGERKESQRVVESRREDKEEKEGMKVKQKETKIRD